MTGATGTVDPEDGPKKFGGGSGSEVRGLSVSEEREIEEFAAVLDHAPIPEHTRFKVEFGFLHVPSHGLLLDLDYVVAVMPNLEDQSHIVLSSGGAIDVPIPATDLAEELKRHLIQDDGNPFIH